LGGRAMPKPGMRWRHCVIGTHNSWLPGDPRGFRAIDHKIHSSGDYKNPPPEGEHSGLHRVLAIAVGGMHCHFLAELPEAIKDVRNIVGQCKTVSSHAIREQMPGCVWGHRGSFKPVDDAKHQRNTFNYILSQENAWVWSFRDDEQGAYGSPHKNCNI
jgi:hypothetical protein